MMKERLQVKGLVTVRVLGRDGNVKRRAPAWFRRLLHIPGRLMEQQYHNIVSREGDALIADALLASPNKAKVTSSSDYIQREFDKILSGERQGASIVTAADGRLMREKTVCR
jgi:hypothetical protein